MLDSNQRPFRCQRKALPTELTTLFKEVIFFLQIYIIIFIIKLINNKKCTTKKNYFKII